MDYQIGIGSVDITPALGAVLVGGVAPFVSDGIATRLWAKAMAITKDDQTALLLTLDTLKFPPSEAAIAKIAAATGIPAQSIWLTASHSHSCPYFEECTAFLEDSLVEAAKQALADRTACRLYTARGVLPGLTGNRRVLKNGKGINYWLLPKEERALWPGKGWPAAGECDQEVITLAVEDEQGHYKAMIFNFACHACTSGSTPTLISADYPGFVREEVDNRLGYETNTLFWPGACGDINACGDSKTLGAGLAQVILESLQSKTPVSGPIAMCCQTVTLKDRDVQEFQEELVRNLWGSEVEHFRECYAEALAIRHSTYPVRVSAIKLGNFLVAGVPGELFCDLGCEIKAAFPGQTLAVAEQTNGAVGYLPTEKAFAQGGYECLYGEHSMVCEEAGTQIKDACIKMLRQLTQK